MIKEREKLYALDKAGKIRVFYGNTEGTMINTFTGLYSGGKITHKGKNVTSGKQKRTASEQADFELDSLYNDKLDEGYKSREELTNHTGITSNDIEHYFKLGNITYNTNRYWLPLPMLAEKYSDHKKKIKFPTIIQPKLNGVRCLTLLHEGRVVFCSRGGQLYELPHLKPIFNDFYFRSGKHSLVFDGEIYSHGVPLQTISGLARLEDDPTNRKAILQYHIYDIFDLDDLGNDNETRDVFRGQVLYELSLKNPKIHIVDSMWVNSHDEIKHKHDEFLNLGYEGAILRDPSSPYYIGFRDKALIKVKEFIDEEFVIVGCEIDPNKSIGESFVFVLENDQTDDTFKARPTGTIEQKEEWYHNIKKYKGKKATVRYFERSVDKIPTMGVLRHEKSKCLVEAIRDYE